MIDYSAMLYDPVYAELGVEATLTAGAAPSIMLTVIDDTRPKTNTSGTVEVRSVGPGAYARIPELAGKGIVRDDYMDAMLDIQWPDLGGALVRTARQSERRGCRRGAVPAEGGGRWLMFARTSWRGCWRWSPPFLTSVPPIATTSISPKTSCRPRWCSTATRKPTRRKTVNRNSPIIVQMTPEIIIAEQSDGVGTDLTTLRRELIKLVLFDTELNELIAKSSPRGNGAIRYLGCQTDLGWMRSLHGALRAQFMFKYTLRPEQL